MKKLSVVIPVFNEAATLPMLIERVQLAPALGCEKEIIVVDDCSTDGSREYLRDMQIDGVKAFFHATNQGKGAALRTGFHEATGDIVLVQDADFEYDPQEYPKLLRPIVEGKADVVLSSRFLGGEEHRVLYFWHAVGNRFLTLLSNMFTNLNLTDMESCYKAFTRSALERVTIEENRFGFEPEIVAKVASNGCRIYEVGVSYAGRTYAEGKKITWKDGVRAIWCIVKYGCRRRR
jgi:glycosyltransferase involved in cell wall biosynthesis